MFNISTEVISIAGFHIGELLIFNPSILYRIKLKHFAQM